MDSGSQTAQQQSIPQPNWHRALAEAVREPDALVDALGLPESLRQPARRAAEQFGLMVPRSFLARMRTGDPADPLLRQVLPLEAELSERPGFTADAVGDEAARRAPGLLHKYAGRALLIVTGSCAVHCRYCFRRHYPYGEEPHRIVDWEPALQTISRDSSLQEIILSGGDPLMLTDRRLGELIGRLGQIPHLRRLRVHSRLPVVLPERVTDSLLHLLRSQTGLTPIMVVHANHPAEVVGECAHAFSRLVQAGITTLNQAVLLRGVNDDIEALSGLCERLVNLGVMPYYLHQLDRVQGTAHFEVPDAVAIDLLQRLRVRLPGYAVPQLVREVRGERSKLPLV